MKRYSDQFIADLSNLIRHGPEPFDRLIADLCDTERRQSLIDALSQLSRIASESTPPNRTVARSSNPFSYEDIQTPWVANGDPKVADMLESLREKLTIAPALRSRRVLEDLTYQLNVPVAKRDSIPRMIQKILECLATRNADEVAKALNWVKEADRGSTESFMDLASFITRSPSNS